MTSKQRAQLKSLAMTMDAIFQIGKATVSDELIKAIDEALEARELIKVSVLKNCNDDPAELAQIVSEKTGSETVQIIGRKIVLYRQARDPKKRNIKLK